MRSLIILLGLLFSTIVSAVTPLNLTTGWNLLGNSSAAPIDVAVTFGDPTKITTVWECVCDDRLSYPDHDYGQSTASRLCSQSMMNVSAQPQ